jgi:hypothetical protein
VKPTTAFDQFQTAVNANPLPDCAEQVPSGSLVRGPQRDPIHDVDLIMVFDREQHSDWDTGPGSAEAALEYVRGQLHGGRRAGRAVAAQPAERSGRRPETANTAAAISIRVAR